MYVHCPALTGATKLEQEAEEAVNQAHSEYTHCVNDNAFWSIKELNLCCVSCCPSPLYFLIPLLF